MARLRKLEPIIVPKIVISVSTMQQSKVVCFVFSDGTVQYRDRATMRELYNEPDLNNIMSLHQVGFQFTNDTPCKTGSDNDNSLYFPLTPRSIGLQAAFSPTGCSIAQICEDGEVKWNSMYYPMEDINTSMQDSELCSSMG